MNEADRPIRPIWTNSSSQFRLHRFSWNPSSPPYGGGFINPPGRFDEETLVLDFMKQFILGDLDDAKRMNSNLPYPKFSSDNYANRISRGGSILLDDEELLRDKNFWKLMLENANTIAYILLFGAIVYICFKKFQFIRKFCRKISNHWIFQNRITKSLIVLARYNKNVRLT